MPALQLLQVARADAGAFEAEALLQEPDEDVRHHGLGLLVLAVGAEEIGSQDGG